MDEQLRRFIRNSPPKCALGLVPLTCSVHIFPQATHPPHCQLLVWYGCQPVWAAVVLRARGADRPTDPNTREGAGKWTYDEFAEYFTAIVAESDEYQLTRNRAFADQLDKTAAAAKFAELDKVRHELLWLFSSHFAGVLKLPFAI